MSKRLKTILSITLLLVVLFIASFTVFSSHNHACEHTFCIQCELIRSINDGYLIFLIIFISLIYVIPFIVAKLTHIIIEYKGRVQSPTKLRVKLRDWFSVFIAKFINTERNKYDRN